MSILNDIEIKKLCSVKSLFFANYKHKELGSVELNRNNSEHVENIWKCLQETFPNEAILSDREKPSSLKLVKDTRMIIPFTDTSINLDEEGLKIPSYGLGSFSYDVRLARNFKVMYNEPEGSYIDLRKEHPTKHLWANAEDVNYITIPPHGFALGTTVERLNVPNDVYITCMAKSTLARSGLMAHVTPIENGWSGYITIELSNMTPYPMIVPSGIGIMALIFHKGNVPNTTYETKNTNQIGKYQNQPQLPIEAIN